MAMNLVLGSYVLVSAVVTLYDLFTGAGSRASGWYRIGAGSIALAIGLFSAQPTPTWLRKAAIIASCYILLVEIPHLWREYRATLALRSRPDWAWVADSPSWLLLPIITGIVIPGAVLMWLISGGGAAKMNADQPFQRSEYNAEEVVKIYADQPWQRSGFRVEEGSSVTIEVVDGAWTSLDKPLTAGEGSSYICADFKPAHTCAELIPDRPQTSLIGRIGYQLFPIGAERTLTAPATGEIELRMNDPDFGLHDNTGVLSVRVQRDNR